MVEKNRDFTIEDEHMVAVFFPREINKGWLFGIFKSLISQPINKDIFPVNDG